LAPPSGIRREKVGIGGNVYDCKTLRGIVRAEFPGAF